MGGASGATEKNKDLFGSKINTYLGYGGLGLTAIGLVGSLLSEGDTPANLGEAISRTRNRIGKLDTMIDDTERDRFTQFKPEAQFTIDALAKLAKKNEESTKNRLARSGLTGTGAEGKILSDANLERESQAGSTIASLASDYENRRQSKLLGLTNMVGGMESQLGSLLATQAQLDAQESAQESQFWTSLGQIGGTLAGLI